ncbi:MAG: cytochrome-c peroxidase [Phaeodactylibacter xiamenensis]|uniref:Cytochrome C peroxidase n=1 Tax=Phaeodactylibacter xiamenensis TaxID=1524460 RepID=A0A098S1U0_9BACT|nr:cytochrome c peroxidase [Phaeodactylibacter xiamenensis]KGE85788.1 cytochrome C peroxidase [Phaeodactylibacter xiamenensis]MCR9050458.1 cytochrome C peroxidase [bacterium]
MKIPALPLFLALLTLTLFSACQEDNTGDPTVCDNCPQEEPILADYNPTDYSFDYLPDHFPNPILPPDNPMTEEGIALGRMLFYDPILSRDSTISCGSCHFQELSFTDGVAVSTGIDGQLGVRSSMPLVNLAFNPRGFFWDGRSATLEEQALVPIEDHREMDESWDVVEEKLRNHPDYPAKFREAFGIEYASEIDRNLAVKAIAQFERTMVSYQSRFDQVVWAQQGWPTEEEQMGRDLFFVEQALPTQEHPGCSHCHGSSLFTENNFFNNGISNVEDLESFPDKGFGEVTGNIYDNGKFRAPTLRNIALTAPYMHDGRFATLEEVLDSYAAGGHGIANEDPNIQPFALSDEQKQAMIAFLNMLTDTSFVNNPAFSNPFGE